MSLLRRHLFLFLVVFLLPACAGWGRGCSSCTAKQFGADWVVVKNDLNGKPFRCWALGDVSITNEGQSDGIYWKSPRGHLVHIAGNYDYVQVEHMDWRSAYAELGLTEETCEALRDRLFTEEELGL
jgi:hypothetical protein